MLNRTQMTDRYGYSRQYIYELTQREDFPEPVAWINAAPLYDENETDQYINGRDTQHHVYTDLYDPYGRNPKRSHTAGVRMTQREKTYYKEKYGSTGAALRHLINEDQKRLHEQDAP